MILVYFQSIREVNKYFADLNACVGAVCWSVISLTEKTKKAMKIGLDPIISHLHYWVSCNPLTALLERHVGHCSIIVGSREISTWRLLWV